jgi:hypothetical protein
MKHVLFGIGFLLGVLIFFIVKWFWTADTKEISRFNQEDDY